MRNRFSVGALENGPAGAFVPVVPPVVPATGTRADGVVPAVPPMVAVRGAFGFGSTGGDPTATAGPAAASSVIAATTTAAHVRRLLTGTFTVRNTASRTHRFTRGPRPRGVIIADLGGTIIGRLGHLVARPRTAAEVVVSLDLADRGRRTLGERSRSGTQARCGR